MPAKKSKTAKTSSSTRGSRARATEPAVLTRLPKPVREAFEDARERSHEFALAGLGMFSNARKQSEARMADWVAEGRRVEPKIKQAVEELKDKLQTQLDKLPKLNLSALRSDA